MARTQHNLMPHDAIPAELWRAAVEHSDIIGEDFRREVAKFLRQYMKRKPKSPKARRQMGEGAFFQRASGLWIGRLELPRKLDGTRDYVEVSSLDKAEAINKFVQLKIDVANHLERLQTGVTVEDWMLKFANEVVKPNNSPSYYRSLMSVIKQQINPSIGGVLLAKLGPHHVRHLRDFCNSAVKEAVVKNRDGSETVVEVLRWKPRTTQIAYDKLKLGLDAAMRERPPLCRENVALLVPRPTAVSEETAHHTQEEARKVLVTALAWKDPNVTLWAARYLTGMRQGELLGLQEDCLDFEALTIDISWQLQWLPLKEGMKFSNDPDRFDIPPGYEVRPLRYGAALTRTKTGKQHLIPMPVELAVMLKIYLQNRMPNPYGLVWVSEQFTPLRPEMETAAWYDALARADVKLIKGHGSRHTTNTLLDVDEATRMQILGHSTAQANRIYLHADLDKLRRGMGELAGILLPEQIVPAEQLIAA